MLGDKLRLRFAKTGTLRLLSHHDLMRCFERMLRRGAVPFKSTAGFHPTPRLVFALSLPLGVAGRDEVVELELTAPCDPADVLGRLAAVAPDGLAFHGARVVPMKATAIPRRVEYQFPLPDHRASDVAARCRELLAREKVWVERTKPTPKRLNIRPYLRSVRVEGQRLVLDLWVTGTGTARADELIRLLGLSELVDAGAVLERTRVEIRDEVDDHNPPDVPPDGPADTEPIRSEPAHPARPRELNQPTEAHRGPSPTGPVVE